MVQLLGSQDVISEEEDGIVIERTSSFTGNRNRRKLSITRERYDAWRSGGQLIQSAFPELSADDREFLLTGCIPEEWNDVFGSEDEEED